MKNTILTLALMLAASSAFAQWSNDLYGNPTPAKKKSSTTVSSGKSEQGSTYSSRSSNYSSENSSSSSVQESDNDELVTSYEKALKRRYNAMRNATYEQPESYWKLMEQYQAMLEKKYNQNLYNIVVIGDEMWVEPQTITAQFDGSDPAEGVIQYNQELRSGISNKNNSYSSNNQPNVTIKINVVDPWDSWGHSSWIWGRPYYSSSYYNPYYNPYYSPYYRPYYNPYYYPSWGGGYYPPHWGGGYYPPRPYWGGGYYPNYYRNPKGTYYGNSRYNNSPARPSYSSGSRPSYSSGSTLGGGRPTRPNGSNTVYGGVRPTSNRGGVTTSRPTNSSFTTRPNNSNRPSSVSRPGSTARPSNSNSNDSRPSSTARPSFNRPQSERSNSSYERPASVSRPASSPSSVSRPASSGGSRSGGSSMGGSSMGGGRPTRR